ncbi:MAG: type II secretion system minor pseudopilin GspK [Oceanicaulis sp.]
MKRSEHGTVMIAALLLVALMAAVAVQLVDLSRFAVLRTTAADARGQAYWYARGARDFAESVLINAGDPRREVMRPDEVWLSGPQLFPIEGGQITGRISDGNNCFNINALADGGAETVTNADPERARATFRALLREIGAPAGAGERLAGQIIDWIDADDDPEPGGAEDAEYARFSPPYRAANRAFTELEELLALPEMTPEFYAVLKPWLCVRPVFEQPDLNPNTLRLDQGALLAAQFDGRLSASDAEAVLFRRPPDGYDALEAFFADPLIARLNLEPAEREGFALRSRWFDMEVAVTFDEARFTLSQLAELDEAGRIRRRGERFGTW